MNRRMRTARVALMLALALVLIAGVTACSSAGDTTEPATTGTTDGGGSATDTASEDPAVALIETKCSMCHSTDRVWAADKTGDEWISTVDRMKTNGLVVTDEEYNQIVDYLSNQ